MRKRHNILLTRTSVKCREIKIVRELKKKKKNSSSYFLADDSLVKLLCLHVIAFYKDDILPF